MTKWQFAKKLPAWSFGEAMERLGFSWTNAAFTSAVAIGSTYLMLRDEQFEKASEKYWTGLATRGQLFSEYF